MTESTHTYTAVLIGAPDVPLSVRGGRVSLDSGRAPHVQGILDIAWPSEATLTALDPRLNARVRVTADAVFPTFSQSRTFNLGLRSRPTRHRDAVVSLDLASDEALLDDYRAPSADRTPRTLETSLRSIVNYVLGKIGGVLAGAPANDADMTAYWELENLVTDPRSSSATGFTGLGSGLTLTAVTLTPMPGTSATGAIRGATSSAGVNVSIHRLVSRVSPGRAYTMVAAGRTDAANTVTLRARIEWLNEAGAIIGTHTGTTVPLSGTSSSWVSVTGTAPAGTVEANVKLLFSGTIGAATNVYGRNWMLVEGLEAVAYFDGSTTGLTGYTTSWQGDPDASTSYRTVLSPIDARDPDSLVWKAGDSALEFLHPLVQAAGFRLVCDESRTWTLRSGSYVAAGSLTFAAGLDVTDATDTLSREGDDWYDAQATIYTWDDANGITRTRVDYWALTPTPTKVNRVVVNAPYPGTGRSQYAVKRAQGRGRVVQAAKVADWAAAAEQPVTALLNGAPTQTGLTESVEFDFDRDEVTISTRTTDTLPGSIDLLGGTIDALVGTINDL